MKQVIFFCGVLFFLISCSTMNKKIASPYSIYYKPVTEDSLSKNKSFNKIDLVLTKINFVPTIFNYELAKQQRDRSKVTNIDDLFSIQFSSIVKLQEALYKKENIENIINQEISIVFEMPVYKLRLGGFSRKSDAKKKLDYFRKLGIFGFVIQSSVIL